VDGEPLLQGDDLAVDVGREPLGDGPAAAENPKPGNEGTITSNASAGSPPCAPGSARGSMTLDQCQNVQGQPWVQISGVGSGPTPGLRMKCTGTPSTRMQ
jgi:hypothetical protein